MHTTSRWMRLKLQPNSSDASILCLSAIFKVVPPTLLGGVRQIFPTLQWPVLTCSSLAGSKCPPTPQVLRIRLPSKVAQPLPMGICCRSSARQLLFPRFEIIDILFREREGISEIIHSETWKFA